MNVTDLCKVESQDLTMDQTLKGGRKDLGQGPDFQVPVLDICPLAQQVFFKGRVQSFNEGSILLLKNHQSCQTWYCCPPSLRPSVLGYNAIMAKPK